MKTIANVKQFVDEFIKWETKVGQSKFDTTTPQKKHYQDVRYFLETFYSVSLIPLAGVGLETKTDDDPDIKKLNYDQIKKRKLFIIRQYEDATFGKGIHTDDNTLFTCILGSNTTLTDIEVYAVNISVGVIDNELKIISMRYVHSKMKHDPDGKIKWDYSKDSVEKIDELTVLKEGKLVATLRIEPPEWNEHLDDYNID